MPVIPFRPPRAPLKVAPPPAPTRRAVAVDWLRRMHIWLGLWGAVLGLLLGGTAILLNHRTAPLEPAVVQVPLPDPAPATPQAMAEWLRGALRLGPAPARVRAEAPRPLPWGERTLAQPAHWNATFAADAVHADYWVGNRYVTVRRGGRDLFGTLSSLHRAGAMRPAWVLLVDMLAGSIILLSLCGIALWALTNRLRTVGLALGAAALLAAAGGWALLAL
jgi:hypothetical protein